MFGLETTNSPVQSQWSSTCPPNTQNRACKVYITPLAYGFLSCSLLKARISWSWTDAFKCSHRCWQQIERSYWNKLINQVQMNIWLSHEEKSIRKLNWNIKHIKTCWYDVSKSFICSACLFQENWAPWKITGGMLPQSGIQKILHILTLSLQP